jgi:hypothetical protein
MTSMTAAAVLVLMLGFLIAGLIWFAVSTARKVENKKLPLEKSDTIKNCKSPITDKIFRFFSFFLFTFLLRSHREPILPERRWARQVPQSKPSFRESFNEPSRYAQGRLGELAYPGEYTQSGASRLTRECFASKRCRVSEGERQPRRGERP